MVIFLIIMTTIAFLCCVVNLSIFNIFYLGFMGLWLIIEWKKKKMKDEEDVRLNNLALKTMRKIIEDNKLEIAKVYNVYCPAYLSKQFERYKQTMQIDEKQRKILFTNAISNKYLVVNFDEILNYEIYEDGSKYATSVDWHGFKTSNIYDNCNELKLIIRLRCYQESQFIFNFIFNSFPKNSPAYKSIMTSLQNVVSFLEVLKNENQDKSKRVFKFCQFCGTKIDINETKCLNCGSSDVK